MQYMPYLQHHCHTVDMNRSTMWLVALASLACLLGSAFAQCGQTHPFVGYSAPIHFLNQHNVGGSITIIDDCTVQVDNFFYDGTAPATVVWAARSLDPADLRAGVALSEIFTAAQHGEPVVATLPAGMTWDDIGAISIWCQTAQADFGHVDLLEAPQYLVGSNWCEESQTHPYVGFKGEFSTLSHAVGGEVEIIDDCSFTVTRSSYDGLAPATYYRGANSTDNASFRLNGVRLSDHRVASGNGRRTVTVVLEEGLTWDGIGAISVWCESVAADFGNVQLAPATQGSGNVQPPPATQGSGCPKTHPFVGFSGPFMGYPTLQHDVSGTVEIVDDCTFTVSGFNYDGGAPATVLWGAPDPSSNGLRSGLALTPVFERGVENELVTVTLRAGMTWDDITVISVWCVSVSADFGHVELSAAMPMTPPAGGCGRTSPYVGFSGEIMGNPTLQHEVSGTVQIVDDCTFMVTGFNYDGMAPATVFWGAADGSSDALLNGQALSPVITMAQDNAVMTISLPEGVTWEDITVISVWCEAVSADFGHVELSTVTTMAAGATAPAPGPSQMEMPDSFENCVEVLPGTYRVYWTLNAADPLQATSATIALEHSAALDAADGATQDLWMGFGFCTPGAQRTMMVGSDAVVGGMMRSGECFVQDYYLGAQAQCAENVEGGAGACPDVALDATQSPDVENTELLGCEKTSTSTIVTFTKSLLAEDQFDHDWPLNSSMYGVWAVGPLSGEPISTGPLVLYHQLSSVESPGAQSSHAPMNFALNLGKPIFNCPAWLPAAPAPAAAPSSAPAGSPAGGAITTIANATTFDVIIGPNPNYPNPPGWGFSYHINGMESPVLQVERGTEYTFRVMAGPEHPLYITDSIIGSYSNLLPANETVYAGGDAGGGSTAAPAIVTWTPDAMTPDTVYYQCYIHQKIGWKVEVYDQGMVPPLSSSSVGGR